ncbi:recombination protein NinB [Salmonella enterica]|nr:hypothetical protein [Salmonella enterica]MLT78290.1 hypothetical protein [Salmonella enterica subsp. enterica serovar Sandiego]EBA1298989.1 hypothetical protein [Salmonella enterica]EBI9418261.1 hypothetical protein [Salmonella enterica]EBK9966607.1 hypothetical protein [Salmonella enterica]
MKTEFCFHESTRPAFWQLLKDLIATGKRYRVVITEWKDRRSISQNSLSHMWYAEISRYLTRRGHTQWTETFTKDAMKHAFLGYEEREVIDVTTGEVVSVRELRKTSKLSTGEMHFYLNQVEAWAGDIGCLLTLPDNSEYRKLREQQVA